jgi:hypothetical protein
VRSFVWGTVLTVLAGITGCGVGPVPAPPVSPSSATEQALAEYDANKDGILDAKELERNPGLTALAAALGKGPGGRLTADELTQQLQSLRAGGAGVTRAACQVLLDRRPLAGATVRYVPEKFLGPDFKPASGISDAAGFATLVTEGRSDGLIPGIYQVEISKKDGEGRETIPARYNVQTTLGCLVGFGPRSGADAVFHLKTAR